MNLAPDELFPAAAEDRVGDPLQPEGGLVAVRDVAAADRSRSVSREEQGLVSEREQLPMDGVGEQSGILRGPRRVGQIGAARLADEEGVSREDPPGSIGRLPEEDGVRDALGRVARRLESPDADRCDLELLTVSEPEIRMGSAWEKYA